MKMAPQITEAKTFCCSQQKRRDQTFEEMQIKVKTLGGCVITLDVEPKDTVQKIKERVEEKEGIPPAQQRLIFGGRAMNDSKTAADYNIDAGNTIHLVLSLRG